MNSSNNNPQDTAGQASRRDFLLLTAGAMGAIGGCAAIVPFVSSMNPSADVLSQSSVDVDIEHIKPGDSITVMWRGKPVFIRRRTDEEVKSVRDISLKTLKDPQTDESRTKVPEWLVVVGICTHLGCIPTIRKSIDTKEDGWLCACHGSKYDASGRILSGPAPRNLDVPVYTFINNNKSIRIGESA